MTFRWTAEPHGQVLLALSPCWAVCGLCVHGEHHLRVAWTASGQLSPAVSGENHRDRARGTECITHEVGTSGHHGAWHPSISGGEQHPVGHGSCRSARELCVIR